MIAVRSSPVFSFLTVTVAPGNTAPLASSTVPANRPSACARAGSTDVTHSSRASPAAFNIHSFVIATLLVEPLTIFVSA